MVTKNGPARLPTGVEPAAGRQYYIHTGTRNESFTRVSATLAASGVKNSRFMLALFDAGLAEIDPRSPYLSEEEQGRVLAEIVANPWYFLREVVMVPVSGGRVPYEIHLGNLFLTWCMVSNINCYLLLPRQNYKTVSACAVYMWIYSFQTTNSHMLFFNKSLLDSQNNLKRVKSLIEELPEWLRDGVLSDPINDRNAIEYIYSEHRKNRIDPKPSATNLDRAETLGRGNTTPLVWYDEISFMPFVLETYMAAVPAQSQARRSAISMGVPYGAVITTTPNSIDTPSGEFAYMLRNGSLRFRLEFYDLGPARVRELIDTQSEYNYLYAEYTYKEIGRSEEWFKEQCRELLHNQMKIKREILLVWPMSTDGSVFTEEQLEGLLAHQAPCIATMSVRPRHGGVPPNLEYSFTEMPDPSVPYIFSIDTAGGVGKDYSAFTLCHPNDLRTVGTMKTNTADDEAVRAVAQYVMLELFPKCVAVIERNYLGVVVINHLLKLPGVEPRIFYLEKERDAERVIGKLVVRSKHKVRVYGVDTTPTSREAMMRHLFQIVEEMPHLVRSQAVQDEIRSLQRKKTGKIEHRSGFHDDVLMSWLMAVYADRHEQPVMRGLLGRQRGASDHAASMDGVSALNVSGDSAPVAASIRGVAKDVSLDDYSLEREPVAVDEAAAKRRRMAAMVASLNSAAGDIPV